MKKKPVIAAAAGTMGPRKAKRYDSQPAMVVAAEESAGLWLTRLVKDGPPPAPVPYPGFDDWEDDEDE